MRKLLFLGLLVAFGNADECKDGQSFATYKCDFDAGYGEISGLLTISQCDDTVMIQGKLTSSALGDGDHGFHVHANNVVTPDCSAAGGHFKSSEKEIHGFPVQALPNRHAGDLGNITVTSNAVTVDISDTIVSLDEKSAQYIGNRSIVIHEKPDDGNPTRDPTSTGAAGARIGCCVLTGGELTGGAMYNSISNFFLISIFIQIIQFI